MASIAPEKQTSISTELTKSDLFKTLLPYGLAIAAHLPLLILYSGELGDRPHYKPWPFAIIAVIGLVYIRWPRDQEMPFHKSTFSNVLLGCGLLTSVVSILFLAPWFSAISVVFFVASLLARVIDSQTNGSLVACALPLVPFIYLPLGHDMNLITWLQRVAGQLTSRLLDLGGLGHHLSGTMIQVPGKTPYGVEQACSGVISFYTLIFVAIVLIVMNRRPWFRATLLLASAVFWAIFMNTGRIFAIPIGEHYLQIDLAHGTNHTILGFIALGFGILMLFSTDQFLMFLFGPVDPTTDDSNKFTKTISKFWNKLIAGEKSDDESRKKRSSRRRPISKFCRMLAWGTAILLLVSMPIQASGIWASFTSNEDLSIRWFDNEILVPMAKLDLPDELSGNADGRAWSWKLASYAPEDRFVGADHGRRSDSWKYQSPTIGQTVVSMDQTFPGWHELTICYRNAGWKMTSRKKMVAKCTINGEEQDWSYILAKFELDTGEKALLLFSLFDAFGEPFEAPKQWGGLPEIMIKIKNRLSHKVRARILQGEAFQAQVFATQYRDFDESTIAELTDGFLQTRSILRDKFIERRLSPDSATPSEEQKPAEEQVSSN